MRVGIAVAATEAVDKRGDTAAAVSLRNACLRLLDCHSADLDRVDELACLTVDMAVELQAALFVLSTLYGRTAARKRLDALIARARELQQ